MALILGIYLSFGYIIVMYRFATQNNLHHTIFIYSERRGTSEGSIGFSENQDILKRCRLRRNVASLKRTWVSETLLQLLENEISTKDFNPKSQFMFSVCDEFHAHSHSNPRGRDS